MSNNQVHILNYSHNIIDIVPENNTIIITDNNLNKPYPSINIPQPVTRILQINTPGPQGATGPSGSQGPSGSGGGGTIDTGSLATTGSNTFIGNQTITGSIIFNEGAQITSTYYGNSYPGYIDIVAGASDGFVELISYNSQSAIWVDNDGVFIITSGSYNWYFNSNGTTTILGGVTAPSFTGSLQGTASWAVSASFAVSSSRAVTASYAINAANAANAANAEYATNANISQIAFYASNANYATSASYAPTVLPYNSYVTKLTQKASETLYSGQLNIGQTYTITNYAGDDDFLNVGAPANETGVTFVATNKTPTKWANSTLVSNGNPFGPIANNTFNFTPQWKQYHNAPDTIEAGRYFFNFSSSYNPDKTAPIIMPNSTDNMFSTIEANPPMNYYIDDEWNPLEFNSGVFALSTYDSGSITGSVLVGGSFTNIGIIPHSYKALVRLDTTGSIDSTFINEDEGFGGFDGNLQVNSIVVDNNKQIIVGGIFGEYIKANESVPVYSLVRLDSEGKLDAGFAEKAAIKKTATPGTVHAVAIEPYSGSEYSIYVGGGDFNVLDTDPIPTGIVKISDDGTGGIGINKEWFYDEEGGFDRNVYAIAIDANNKVIIAGEFTEYRTVDENKAPIIIPANGIIRLRPNGLYDDTFVYGTGFDVNKNIGPQTIAIQPDGKILVGGGFSRYNGTTANKIIRLNSDGSIDTTFNTDTGFNDIVYSITLQPEYGILIGGKFTSYKGDAVSLRHILRLNDSGSILNKFSGGVDNDVYATLPLPYGKCMLGGAFNVTYYNDDSNNITTNYLTQLYASYDVVLSSTDTSNNIGDNKLTNTLVEVTQYN
jgi:uncharacterized delta-60 repeat protein